MHLHQPHNSFDVFWLDVKETKVDAKETKADAKEIKTDTTETKADTKEIKADAKETKADAKEIKTDAKAIKIMVEDIVNKMDTHNCLYPLEFVSIPCSSSLAVIGEEVLRKLKSWLSPPDPSTNYTTGLRNHNEETAHWCFEGRIFQEWHSTGSLLWIHGKRMFSITW